MEIKKYEHLGNENFAKALMLKENERKLRLAEINRESSVPFKLDTISKQELRRQYQEQQRTKGSIMYNKRDRSRVGSIGNSTTDLQITRIEEKEEYIRPFKLSTNKKTIKHRKQSKENHVEALPSVTLMRKKLVQKIISEAKRKRDTSQESAKKSIQSSARYSFAAKK